MHVLILNIEFIYCTYNSIKKEIAISLMFIKGMLESQTGSYYIYMIVVFMAILLPFYYAPSVIGNKYEFHTMTSK